MKIRHILRAGTIAGVTLTLAGCGGISSGNLFGGGSRKAAQTKSTGPMPDPTQASHLSGGGNSDWEYRQKSSTVWDLFSNADDPNVKLEVNKYIWNASLEVLDFLPIQTVDPFSGLIVTGYGTPRAVVAPIARRSTSPIRRSTRAASRFRSKAKAARSRPIPCARSRMQFSPAPVSCGSPIRSSDPGRAGNFAPARRLVSGPHAPPRCSKRLADFV